MTWQPCVAVRMWQSHEDPHTGSYFLTISAVSCDTDNGRYEPLLHCGTFGSKFGCMKRQLRSGDERGDDTISAVIWEAILAQSNSLSWENCTFSYGNAKDSLRNSWPNIPNCDMYYCSHSPWTFTTQVCSESNSKTWSTMFDCVW